MTQLFTYFGKSSTRRIPEASRGSTAIRARALLRSLFLLVLLSFGIGAQAQLASYTFSTGTGATLDPMTGSTVIVAADAFGGDDLASTVQTIGFNFTFNGTTFTQFSASSNGLLRLGATAVTTAFTNTLISTSFNPKIMPGWDDLATGTIAGGGNVRTVLTGTAPNRVRVIQYFLTVPRATGGAANATFQCWLYETTNVVEFRYGTSAGNFASATIGISNATVIGGDYNVVTSTTAHTSATSTTAAVANNQTTWPGSGRRYTWTPSLVCTGTPAVGTTVAATNPVCGGNTTALSMSSLPLGSGYTYQWQSAPDVAGVPGAWTNIGGATATTTTQTINASTWYRCVVTCTGSGLSANSTQLLVNRDVTCYCVSSATSTADEEITSITVDAFTNASTCGVAAPGPGSVASMYSNFYTLPTPVVRKGVSIPVSITTVDCDPGTFYTRQVGIYIDGNQDGFFGAGEQVYLSPFTGGTNPVIFTANITIPIGFNVGVTGMRIVCNEIGPNAACGTYSWGETEDYRINLQDPPPCAGSPSPSATNSSSASVCSGVNFGLSLATTYTDAGLTFQWQSGPAIGGPYTNISGATNPTATVNQTVSTFYRCVITCTNGGATTNSTPIQVNMASGITCNCASQASNGGDEDILNVSIGTLNNNSTCAALAPGPGSIPDLYSNYTTLAPTNLDLSVTYPFSVGVRGCSGAGYNTHVNVYIDFNGDGDFIDAGENVYASTAPQTSGVGVNTDFTGNITIPCTATVGLTTMRVIAAELFTNTITPCGTYTTWGETEDYRINITNGLACVGAPSPATTVSSVAAICPSTPFNLTLSTSYPSCDYTFLWEGSTNGGATWNPLTSTTSVQVVSNQAVTTQYRCIITCTNSGLSVTSTPVTVTQNNLLDCYCVSSATSAADEEIIGVSLASINQPSACGTLAPGPGSVASLYSNYKSVQTDLTLTETNVLNVQITECSFAFSGIYVNGWIDYNRNGVLEASEALDATPDPTGAVPVAPASLNVPITFTVPGTATPGLTLMRVVLNFSGAPSPCGTYTWGETEDYVVNLVAPPACSGTPTPGTIPSTLAILNNTSISVTPVGLGIELNNAYQWEESDDNGVGDPWSPVVGGTGANAVTYNSPNLTSTIWYRLRATCTTSGLDATTNSMQVSVVGGASCADPYIVASLPFQLTLSSNGAGNEIGAQTACSPTSAYGGGQDVVFQFTAPAAGDYEISVVNTSNTRSIGWFLKDNLNCNTTASSLACAVSQAIYNSAHDVVTLAAGTYFVVVDYAAPVTSSNFFVRIRQVPAAPANDNCAGATLITHTPTSTCSSPVTGTLAGATDSGLAEVCAGGDADDDIWYRFVATSEAAVVEVNTVTNGVIESGANLAWEAYSGACGTLTSLGCRNGSASRGVAENTTVTGLTVGQTYYIRVYDFSSGYGSAGGNISICVFTPPPPVNDECAGAVSLAVGASCVNVTGNTVAATQSLAASACNGFTGNADDDIWYTFTLAAPTTVDIRVEASNNTMDPVAQLYTGSCGSLTNVDCADRSLAGGFERINRPLAAGVYFMRVYHYGVGTGAGGAHTVCITTALPAASPANDNTCTATALTMGVECSPAGPFQSQNATRTLNQSIALQGDGNTGDDVWFRFTTNLGQTSATISVQGGGGYNPVFQVLTMSNCKTITAVFPAMDNTTNNGIETQTVFGLTGATTYYVRVFDWFATNPSGSFTICVYETPAPPNDKFIAAELLFQQNAATCFSQTPGYTVNATPGDYNAPGACGGNADDNVWYRFQATNTTATITVTGSQGFDPTVELRSGAGGATSVTCVNANGANGTETINATGLTIGANYYIQVYNALANPNGWGTFDICVFGPPAPPANDNCAGAIGLPNTSPCTAVPGVMTGATVSLPSTCGGGTAFDVWYSFIASTTTATLTPIGAGGLTDMVVEVYSGTCAGTLTSIGCADNDPAPGVENLVVAGLTPGQTYYTRVHAASTVAPGSLGGPNPNFTLCYTGVPPGNDNICGATLTAVSSGRVDINSNNLGATNATSPAPTGVFTSWNNDVWFRSVVPANGVIAISVTPIGFPDIRLRVYSSSDNTCNGTLNIIGLDDDNGPALGSFVYLSGLTPGNTVFYAVDGFSAANFGQFRMNVNDGWLWTGAGGFTYNGAGNWINQEAGSSFPSPADVITNVGSTGWASTPSTVLVNIPVTTNQPIYTASQSLGGVKFVGGVFTQTRITVNSGQTLTLNGTTFAGTGRGITGVAAGGRFEGAGRLDIGAAVSGQTVTVNYPTRFRLATTVLGTANVQSNGNMIFDNGASLYSGQAGPNSLVNGNITYRRQGNTSQVVYNFWSSPITNGVLSSLAAPGFVPNLYQYNTANATGLDYLGTQAGWDPLTPATAMAPGRGYIATGAGLANFTGLPQQGAVSVPAATGAGGNNFNLLGNPYPAPISALQFLTTNSARLNPASIYIWDDDASGGTNYAAGDFITYSTLGTVNGPNSGLPFSGNIASCQGFFVNHNGSGGNFTFDNTMKVYGTNSEFFDASTVTRMRLRMENSNAVASETIIAFLEDATDAADQAYDAPRLAGNADMGLYTYNGSYEYAIQAWPTLSAERVIDLGTVNTLAGPSTITINMFENFDPTVMVYLEDIELGLFHNLTQNPTYPFNNNGLNGETLRFRLHFRAPIAVASSMDCSGTESGKIIIANPNVTPVSLELKNANNEVVATAAPFVGEHEVSNLAAGNYVLNMVYDGGGLVTRNAVIETNGMTAPASFIASATTVSIADAIIEFQGTAQGASEYIWDFGDGTIVTGDLNPVHAYTSLGVYTVTFTALNNGCGSTATSTVSVTNDATGIGSATTSNGFSIFPNPATDVANLLLNVDRTETKVTISINDAAGRLVSTKVVNDVRSGAVIGLDINGLANGVYQVSVEGKNFRNVGRLTIAK